MTENENKVYYYGKTPDFLHRAAAVAANTASSLSTSTTLVFPPLLVPPAKPESPRTVTLSPTFKYGFWATCTFTVLMLLASAALAIWAPDTDGAKTLLDLCEHLLSLGFGAIIGLIGGKATG